MKLKNRLLLTFLTIGLLPLLIIGAIASLVSSAAIEKQAFSQLISVRDIKKSQIDDYFTQRKSDIHMLSLNLQHALDFTSKQTLSESAHISHDYFKQFINSYGYYDLFLIDDKGEIFYTVTKEADYQTNLFTGPYQNSGLGELLAKVVKTQSSMISDFSRYAPSNNDPAAFIALPFTSLNGSMVTLALQLSIEPINHVMTQRTGMGKTGESYLIGNDLLMRSDSYLDPKGHSVKASFAGNVANNGVNTEAAKLAISGKSGSKIITDYNGNPVLSAYTAIDIDGIRWGLLSEIDVAEALQSIDELYLNIFGTILISIIIITVVALLSAKAIIKPLGVDPQEIKQISKTIALGNLTVDFNQRHENESVYGAMKYMTKELHQLISKIIDSSNNLASVSEQTSTLSSQSAFSLKEQQFNIEQIATAVEQMSMTINEVAQNAANVSHSTQMAKSSANEANQQLSLTVNELNKLDKEIFQASTVITSLASDSSAIGTVLEVIRGIAEQTNLLALNAAIEAARAGEQGRGFAVVADEVRQLASKTQESTANIESMIGNLQNASNDAVTAISNSREVCRHTMDNAQVTSRVIDDMNTEIDSITQMTEMIATSVEEQSSVSHEISQNVTQINDMAFENSSSAEQVSTASKDISNVADILNQLTLKFKTT